jgi:hypothetical protein
MYHSIQLTHSTNHMNRSPWRRGFHLTPFALAFACLLFCGFSTFAGASALAQGPDRPQIGVSYHNDVSPALRDMPPWPVQVNQQQEAAENPLIVVDHQDVPDLIVDKGTLLGQLAPSIPAPILTFAGIPYPGVGCFCAPPDTNGEVGATQYVQIVNKAYQVFSKTTGSSVLGPKDIASIWSGFGGVCQTGGRGDPVVLYDQIAKRWIISQFAGTSIPTDECVAVSTTSDATGTWYRYAFHIGSNFIDYPKLSVWPDAYYMSINVFNSTGTAYLGPQAVAFNRAQMIVGTTPASFIVMPILGSSFPPMLPADLDGPTLPSASAPNSYVLWPNTNTYRVYHFKVGVPFGSSPTFTLFASPASTGFTQLCPGTRACVPQLGTTDKLDALADRPMFRLAYRKFADHESLVGNFTVSSGGVAGLRWFELRGVTAGPVTVYQQSTYQPDTTWRWMGSAAMDGHGHMAIGFSASSATIHPQLRYAGRFATDPLNTLAQGEAHLFDGNGSQTGSFNRWGDYSDMTVDPVDDTTLWYTNEYYDTVSGFNWRTRIGKFQLAPVVYTIYTTQVPASTVSGAAEVGTQFTSSLSGYINKLRYWQASGETGSHTLRLWTDTGTLLATATIAVGSPNVWNVATLTPSIAVSAGVKYRVSYNTNSQDAKTFFAGYPINNGPLSALNAYWDPMPGKFPTIQSTSWFFADVTFSLVP